MTNYGERLFVAISLPGRVRKVLVNVQGKLKREAGGEKIKWVEKENLHQSIVFLGQIEEKSLKKVEAAIKDLAINRIFTLNLTKIGFFPDNKRIRVIWVGLGGETEKLSSCYHQLRVNLGKANIDFDSRFSPHITLGRVRFSKGKVSFSKEVIEDINGTIFAYGTSFIVDKIVLFKSKLTPSGPIYTPVFKMGLQKVVSV